MNKQQEATYRIGAFLVIALLLILTQISGAQETFTAKSLGDYGNVTVMEVTGNYDAPTLSGSLEETLPRRIIAQEFLKTHKDEYDFLVIFTNFDFQMPEKEARAFYMSAKNDTQGIGQELFDYTQAYGSSGKLQGTIDMGNLAKIIVDPLDQKFEETVSILSHEMMHRWAAYVKFKDSAGVLSPTLLGYDGSHWSFLLDSGGSVMYGNKWLDNDNGTFTTTTPQSEMKLYSRLDLYLMGMIDKSKVPSMLLIDNPNTDTTQLPQAGITVTGTAQYVTIDQIIAAMGPRLPDASSSQKNFKSAFIFITQPGTFTGSELYGIENIRNAQVTRFSILTDGAGIMQVASTPRDNLPVNPGVTPPPVTPRTLPPNINDGVTWLTTKQKTDGSWIDQPETIGRDTSQSVLVLGNFATAQQNYQAGLQWLVSNTTNNTDYLAREIEALAQSGQDASAPLQTLLARQNPDGGWGSDNAYLSNAMDTAFVLKALSATAFADQAVLTKAVGYLKAKQNSDGGWSGDDGGSTVQPTSAVLSAFNKYRTAYQLNDAITSGTTWLKAKQNSDGGFGNSPSTVYDTAVAIRTLQELNAITGAVGNGVAYLLIQQSGDGSWNESAYQTALAVGTIYNATLDPDLSIKPEDVSVIPSTVSSVPANIVISANIWNLGRTGVSQAKVALYDGNPASGNKVGEQLLAFPGQVSTAVTFSAVINDGNEHLYYFVIDPDNLVKESNKLNNKAVKAVTPQPTYDFEVPPSGIIVVPNTPDQYQDVTIKAKITNKGTMNAYDVQVRYFIDEPGAPYEIATLTTNILAGATVTKEVVWNAKKAGINMPLAVEVDPLNSFIELSETNNKASTPLTVNVPNLTDPNLTISYKDIVVTPNPVTQGGSVSISALVKNEGFSTASNVVVHLYRGIPGDSALLLGTQTIPSLVPGANVPVAFDWTTIQETGEKLIYLVVDPENQVKEISENDNAAFATLVVRSLTDLVVSSDSLAFMPTVPKTGEKVTVSVTVQNTGDVTASNVPIFVYEGDTVLWSQVVPSIEGTNRIVESFDYDSTGKIGTHTLTLKVDPSNVVCEANKNNNTASRTLTVLDSTLAVSEPYFSPNGDGVKDTTQFFFILDGSQDISVAVVNKDGKTVRTFSGTELANAASGSVIWDGRNDDCIVVDDGQYTMQVRDFQGNNLKSAMVVVDNNRSPLADAIGTKYLLKKDMECDRLSSAPGILQYLGQEDPYNSTVSLWLPDDSGILLATTLYLGPGIDKTDSSGGIFIVSPDGSSTKELSADQWPKGKKVRNMVLSNDGSKAALVMADAATGWRTELWLLDITTKNMVLLDQHNYNSQTDNCVINYPYLQIAPNNAYVSYQITRYDGAMTWSELWTVDALGTTKTMIATVPIADYWHTSLLNSWSPDGQTLTFYTQPGIPSQNEIWAISPSGQDKRKIATGVFSAFHWIDSQFVLTIETSSYPYVEIYDTITGNKKILGSASSYILSNDKKRIAFSGNDLQGNQGLVISDFDGNYSTIPNPASTYGAWYGWLPQFRWSPDDRWIANMRSQDGTTSNSVILVIDLIDTFSNNQIKQFVVKEGVPSGGCVMCNTSKNFLEWLPDSRWIRYEVFNESDTYSRWDYYDSYVLDINTGSSQLVDADHVFFPASLSPKKTYLTATKVTCGCSAPKPVGVPESIYQVELCGSSATTQQWITESMLNLTAALTATRDSASIQLSGTATDLNFEKYVLEYATAGNPSSWNMIAPPSDVPIVNGVFASWVPPSQGAFTVTLTAWDKAGNTATSTQRLNWGALSNVSNFFKSPDIISPNGDGIKDSVELHYKVLDPINLEFSIFDANGKIITTIQKSYASPADDFIAWDGRDAGGVVVPDGKYTIKVLDFEFPVSVDTTKPDIQILLSSIDTGPSVTMEGHAVDNNLKSWVLEYGEGDNPGEWHEFMKGEDLLVKKDSNGIPILNPDKSFSNALMQGFLPAEIGWLGGKKFRITAEDSAGNKASAITSFIEEKLVLYLWDGIATWPSSSIPVPADLVKPGVHAFAEFETIRSSIRNMYLQYWNGTLWNDVAIDVDTSQGTVAFNWDSSGVQPQDALAVRMKAVDAAGQEYYSEAIWAGQMLSIRSLICEKWLQVRNALFEKLVLLQVQAKSDNDPNYSTWKNFVVIDTAKGDRLSEGSFDVQGPNIGQQGWMYNIRVIGIGESGRVYSYGGDPPINFVSYPAGCPLNVDFTVKYAEAGCGTVSNKAYFSTVFDGNFAKDNLLYKTLGYYIEKPTGKELLRLFDFTRGDGIPDMTLDTGTLAEGHYPVIAEMTFVDLDTNRTKQITDNQWLIVDRVLPGARIDYPKSNISLCPTRVVESGVARSVVDIEGVVSDNVQMKKYAVLYGSGTQTPAWTPATTRVNGKNVEITGTGDVDGRLGTWDITDVHDSILSLQLKVTDAVGNTSCAVSEVVIDNKAVISSITSDKALFSPNGDRTLDDVTVSYTIDEYSTVDVKVYRLVQSNGSETLDSTAVRTIASKVQHLGGTGQAVWDGKADSGSVVPDGRYGIAVSMTDPCGNTTRTWVPVEVDNTPPGVAISYPQTADVLGSIVEVKGTAGDLHFSSYTLEAGQGDTSASWTTISSGGTPVSNGVLGKWNTAGLSGKWTLKLTASDSIGNKNTTSVTLDYAVAPKNLITALAVSPAVFSPNDDGKLETANISYTITNTCNVKIEIIDSKGAITRSYSVSSQPAGTYNQVWDGRDGAGARAVDGTYSARLTTVLSADASVSQAEAVTVAVDTTGPAIDIKQPVDNAFIRDSLSVAGSISDQFLAQYSVSYAGSGDSVLLDQGNQPRGNYTFGTINNLADGTYTLSVKAKDLLENSVEKKITFTMDKTPPAVKLDTPGDGEYYGGDKSVLAVTGSIVEKNLDSYALRYGGGENPAGWTNLVSGNSVTSNPQLFTWKTGKADGMADGVYTLSLYARDKAGSEGEVKIKITIDNTPPEAAITAPHDGDYVKQAIDIKGTASDLSLDKHIVELSEGQCSTAFKWAAIKTAATGTQSSVLAQWQALPSDGDYCLRLTATDKSGNKTETKINVKVDTHPPAAPVLSGKLENKANAKLEWTRNTEPDLAGYNLYRNNQKINAALLVDNNYSDQNLAEGIYDYTVKAVDLAGWESTTSNDAKLTADLTPPDAKIQAPLNNGRANGIVNISGTAYSSNDFKQYSLFLGQGASPANWTLIRTSPVPVLSGLLAKWDTAGLEEGEVYSLKLETEDLSGNINRQQISVTIDNRPPQRPVLVSVTRSNADVTITWNANSESDLAGYLLYRNDQLANATVLSVGDLKPYIMNGTSYLDKALPDGTFTYYLMAVDQTGNMSGQSNSFDVSIDMHAPHATIVDPADKSKFESKFMVQADCPDFDVASVQLQYKKSTDSTWRNLDSAATARPYITYFDPAALGLVYGDYSLKAVATDKGGKTDASPSTITITYTDLTAPAAPQELHAQTNGNTVTLKWKANGEPDIIGYNVYRNSTGTWAKINTTIITTLSYLESNLTDTTYSYRITAVDRVNNESAPSAAVSARVYAPVITQPFTPTDQQAIQLAGGNAAPNAALEITIQPASDPAFTVNTNADSSGNFSCPVGLANGENRITAKAIDGNGNASRVSDTVVVVRDQAPAAPTGLIASVTDYNVHLTWNRNSEPDLAGYNLFRGGTKINAPVSVTGGIASASSTYTSSYSASYALDGNSSTYWMSSSVYQMSAPIWWQLALAAPELITHIEIHWYTNSYYNYVGKNFEIQAWSGYAWVPLARLTGNTVQDTIIDVKPSYRTDKIRVYITDTNYSDPNWKYTAIAEVRVLKDGLISAETFSDLNLGDGKYGYSVSAVDYRGFESAQSDQASAEVGDVTPPSAPQNLTAVVTGPLVALSWTANSEPDFAGYNVYRKIGESWNKINGQLIGAVTYTDPNLSNGTYSYRVTAVDRIGNESAPSEAVAAVNVKPPDAPSDLTATPVGKGSALTLSWDYGRGSSQKFNLHRSLTAGGPYSKINSTYITGTVYVDTGLTNGTTYYYVCTAADAFANESAYSNQAAGMPQDTAGPSKPLILSPAKSGDLVTLYTRTTDISGFTEANSTVELFKDGAPAGTVATEKKDIIQTVAVGSVSEPAVSPDGKTLAYSNSGSIWAQDLGTGQARQLISKGYTPAWSPDAGKIAYWFYDNNWYQRIGVFDVAAGQTSSLTNDTYVNEYGPSLSADGSKIAFVSSKGGSNNIWLKDIANNSAIQVTTGMQVNNNPRLSPDGMKVAYFGYSSSNYRWSLYAYDSASDATRLVDSSPHTSYIDWSPDGKKIAFISSRTGNYKIFVYDTTNQNLLQFTSTSDSEYDPHWSPDGKSITYTKGGSSLWIASYPPGQNRQVRTGSFNYLAWLKSGEIAYLYGSNLDFIEVDAGYFQFRNISLNPGENAFYAVAVDQTRNGSEPSDPITVLYGTGTSPDLTVTADDVYLYPPYPVAGEQMAVNIVVSNKGRSTASGVSVDVYLWNALGQLELLQSDTISSLALGSSDVVSAVWDSTGKAGENRFVVVIDAADTIAEMDETNNMAIKDFIVTVNEGVALTTALDNTQYAGGQNVGIKLTAWNNGIQKNMIIEAGIEDENGYLLTALDSKGMVLDYGTNQEYDIIWNTGSTYAGRYVVHAVLKDVSSSTLAEKRTPFIIAPDTAIALTAVTDKSAYGPGENVSTSITIQNAGANYIIPALQAIVQITDTAGGIVTTEVKNISNLMPGSFVNLSSFWYTGLASPGIYTATVTVSSDGVPTTTKKVSFTINSLSVLSGAITVSPVVIGIGNAAQISYTLTNAGNTDASGYTARISIIDPETETIQQTQDQSVDVVVNASKSGQVTLSTNGFGLKTYKVLLQLFSQQGTTRNIASTSFTVKDLIAPVVTVVTPAANGTYRGTIILSALAIDNASGVESVEYQVDGSIWKLLTAAEPTRGRYSTTWNSTPAENGPHTVYFRATDKAGNTSTPVPVIFTIQTDTTPPVLTLSTLPDGAYTNKAALNITGTATDDTAVQGVTINDTAVTVNADGTFSHVISLISGTNGITTIAADTAGNTTTDVRTITLDRTAPAITITNPEDNSITNRLNSMITGTVDKTAAVTVAMNDGNPLPADMADAGFSLPVALGYGRNTIQVAAVDRAGNTGVVKRTVTFDDQNPSLSVTYPAEDMTTRQKQMILTGEVSDLTAITVTVAVDGNVLTPAVIDGKFEQAITFAEQKTYQINVTAVDELGNQSLVQRNVIYNKIPGNFGIFGATGVSLSGGYVDSYDSTQGAYAGVHGSNVSVGTNATASGAINLSGGAADYGDAYVGPAGDPARAITTSGGARIYGAKDSLSMLKDMAPVSDPGGGTPVTFTNGTTLTSGTYRVSSISLSGGGRGTIDGNVTLYVTGSLTLSGHSQIVIMPGGSLTIYLNGSLNVSGGSIVNETLNPHNLAIYGTSTCTRATYSGNSVFYGVIYAPAAKLTVSGGGEVYGSVIGNTVTISGGTAVHYDDSLGKIGL